MENKTKKAISWLTIVAVATICFGFPGLITACVACNEDASR